MVAAFGQNGNDPKHLGRKTIFELEYGDDPAFLGWGNHRLRRNSNDIMTRSNALESVDDPCGYRGSPTASSGRDNYSSPRFSPHGRRLAYISGAEGSPQLYVRWMDTGQTALLTNLIRRPSAISWSTDGTQIALTMSLPVDKKPLATPPEKPKGARWSEPVRIIDTLRYQRDGRGIVEEAYTHVFVVPAEGGTPRQLTQGNFNHRGPLSWMPDGKEILISANRHKDWEYETIESDVFAVSVVDGVLRQLTNEPGEESSPWLHPWAGRLPT